MIPPADKLHAKSKPSAAFSSHSSLRSQRPAPSRPNPPLAISAFSKGIKLTLYTDDPVRHCVKVDILDLHIDHATLAYDEQTRTTRIAVANIQLDNQLHSAGNYDFPVLLCAQQPIQSAALPLLAGEPLPHPAAIDAFLAQLSAASPPALRPLCELRIVCYERSFDPEDVQCTMQPLSAYIEDKYINVLLDFVLDNLPGNLRGHTADEEPEEARQVVARGEVLVPRQVSLQAWDLAQAFQLRRVRIEPVSVLLSVHTCMR